MALAWYDDAERNGEPMVIFLAALEPALFLLAEHVKEGREALRAAHEKNERETADELAEIRAEIARLKLREAALRAVFLRAPQGQTAWPSAPRAQSQPLRAGPRAHRLPGARGCLRVDCLASR